MSFYDASRDILAFFVRAFGLVLLLFGLWLALQVLNEAWQLYHEPGRIERFAQAVEKGSNIDRSIAPLQFEGATEDDTESDASTSPNVYGEEAEQAQQRQDTGQANAHYRFRLSYYVAWVLALLLLLLLARIALAAVRTGGELVLYETQMKRFARELVRESARARSYDENVQPSSTNGQASSTEDRR